MISIADRTPGGMFAGKRPVVLVTGGSRGIGLAIARGFAARRREVLLVARDAACLQDAARSIQAEFAVAVEFTSSDLTRPGAVAVLLAGIDASGCYVDTLVNCAGVAVLGPFLGNDAEAASNTRTLNIDVATELMHACLPGMVERGRGGVLNVASLAGIMPMPYLAVYGATKSYLIALSRAVATETAGTGVTVSVLLPGAVDTDFLERNLDERSMGLLPGLSPEAVAHTAIEGHLAGQRVITPGMLGLLCRLGAKFLPYQMLAPFVGRALTGRAAAPAVLTRLHARRGPVRSPIT